MNPYLIFAVIIGLGAYSAVIGGCADKHGRGVVQAKWDAQAASDAQRAAERGKEVAESNTKEVTKYVDVVRTVEVSVPRVVTKLVSLCPAGHPSDGVPSSSDPAAPAQTDAGSGQLDDLAADIIAARENTEQCRALINVVQAQAPK